MASLSTCARLHGRSVECDACNRATGRADELAGIGRMPESQRTHATAAMAGRVSIGAVWQWLLACAEPNRL
jgi:hypothetical protein